MSIRTVTVASVAAVAAVAFAACGDTKTETVTTTVSQTVTTPPVTVTASAPTPTQTTPPAQQSCGQVDVSFPDGGEGSATKITATGLDCSEARTVVEACMNGTVTSGWDASFDGSTTITLTADAREIRFNPVGGGGCGI